MRAQKAAKVDRALRIGSGASAAGALGSFFGGWELFPYMWAYLCGGAAVGAFAPLAMDSGRMAALGRLAGQWIERESDWDALWRRLRDGQQVTDGDVAAARDKDEIVRRVSAEKEKGADFARVRAEVEASAES